MVAVARRGSPLDTDHERQSLNSARIFVNNCSVRVSGQAINRNVPCLLPRQTAET